MRIAELTIRDTAGLGLVQARSLSDVVVFAGPNGVGKTRILSTLIAFFRNPTANPKVRLIVEATAEHERREWQKSTLDTGDPEDAAKLRVRLQKNQKRSKYGSTVLNFDSDRAITKVAPFAFTWDWQDPLDEEIGWDSSFGYLRDRFSDVQHSLYRLVEGQRRKIADTAVSMMAVGEETMKLDFKDPIEPYRKAFSELLGPKRLVEVDVKSQQITYELDGEIRNITTLSSGEREVVNIVFDFLLRQPSNCIVFFDEPELHLHPELSYRLLQTISTIGENNQFIFCTHSPEIITASIENSVVFVAPKGKEITNQAIMVERDDATHHALNLLGQSVGVISLGRKILLIEGEESSLDKQTYGAILKNEYPELVLVPVGGKSSIRSFNEAQAAVIGKTIWGVAFYMLCDRDAQYAMGMKSVDANRSERFQVLPRYHLENYFLDEGMLANVFSEMEPSDSWLRDKDAIGATLRGFAAEFVPYAVALRTAAYVRESVGNIDVMPKRIGSTLESLILSLRDSVPLELARVNGALKLNAIEQIAEEEYARLASLLQNSSDAWKADVPGRSILGKFAHRAAMPVGRLKTLYLKTATAIAQDPFLEIRSIFRSFRSADASHEETRAEPAESVSP